MFNSGYETRALDFEFEENGEKFTDVKGGCAALLEDKMMYFGGIQNPRQVSENEIVSESHSKLC